MQKFSWRTMIIFVMVLLLAVILLGLGTAYVSKLKQERRRLSESFGYRAFMEVTLAGGMKVPGRACAAMAASHSGRVSNHDER
jgi:hypothetical protein